jgi:hypothetical protein
MSEIGASARLPHTLKDTGEWHHQRPNAVSPTFSPGRSRLVPFSESSGLGFSPCIAVHVFASKLARYAKGSEGRAMFRPNLYWTENRRHSSGTPLRLCAPRSPNLSPEPATRSLTVLETNAAVVQCDTGSLARRCSSIVVSAATQFSADVRQLDLGGAMVPCAS